MDMQAQLSRLSDPIPLLVCYTIIGACLKYIDQVFDEGIWSRSFAWLSAIGAGILAGLLCSIDLRSTEILFGVTLAVIISGKVDIAPFAVASILTITIPAASTLLNITSTSFSTFNFHLLGAYILFGWLDEKFSDLSDSGYYKSSAMLRILFELRPFSKIGALLLAYFAYLDYVHAFCFTAFDIGYYSVQLLSVPAIEAKQQARAASPTFLAENLKKD